MGYGRKRNIYAKVWPDNDVGRMQTRSADDELTVQVGTKVGAIEVTMMRSPRTGLYTAIVALIPWKYPPNADEPVGVKRRTVLYRGPIDSTYDAREILRERVLSLIPDDD